MATLPLLYKLESRANAGDPADLAAKVRPKRGVVISNELIDRLRDQEGV